MNERFLSKAKSSFSGDWVEGYYYSQFIRCNHRGREDDMTRIHHIIPADGMTEPDEIEIKTLCQIAPETLSMREESIPFENDLILMLGERYKVELLSDHWILRPINTNEDRWLELSSIGFGYTIVGNIHDK